MPTAPVRPCTRPTCPNLSTGGLCASCRDIPAPEQKSTRKSNPFYGREIWRKESKAYRNAHPLCELCLPKTKVVAFVDHIHELSDGGEPLNWDNLMSLCRSCHADKTARMKKARKYRDPHRILKLVYELKRMRKDGIADILSVKGYRGG